MTATAPRTAGTFVKPGAPIDTPALVVDEAILMQNITEMAEAARRMGVNLRPHIKTHKTPEIARLQIEHGAVGITCAKLGEAEVMADAGIRDILIAYPIVGELKMPRLLALMDRVRMILAVDTLEGAQRLSKVMTEAGKTLDIYVEVNTGQDRSGVKVGDDAVAFAIAVSKLPGLRLVGIMTHEGQANIQPPDKIEAVALEAGRALVETAERIRAAGVPLETVSVGSTPAFAITPTVAGITEMRPGTYVFKDNTHFRYGLFGPDRCAARILVTVASKPAPDRAIVDSGSKTLTMDKSHGYPGHGYIVGHPNAKVDRLSEEHGVVIADDGVLNFEVGDVLEIIPNHICPAVNLQDELVIIRDGVEVDRWKIAARGKIR